jgi:hypothetical protein
LKKLLAVINSPSFIALATIVVSSIAGSCVALQNCHREADTLEVNWRRARQKIDMQFVSGISAIAASNSLEELETKTKEFSEIFGTDLTIPSRMAAVQEYAELSERVDTRELDAWVYGHVTQPEPLKSLKNFNTFTNPDAFNNMKAVSPYLLELAVIQMKGGFAPLVHNCSVETLYATVFGGKRKILRVVMPADASR